MSFKDLYFGLGGLLKCFEKNGRGCRGLPKGRKVETTSSLPDEMPAKGVRRGKDTKACGPRLLLGAVAHIHILSALGRGGGLSKW